MPDPTPLGPRARRVGDRYARRPSLRRQHRDEGANVKREYENPGWRSAAPDETPGQCEPELTESSSEAAYEVIKAAVAYRQLLPPNGTMAPDARGKSYERDFLHAVDTYQEHSGKSSKSSKSSKVPHLPCPKCGHDDVKLIHTKPWPKSSDWSNCPMRRIEHFHRRCARCDYEWVTDDILTSEG